MTADSGWYAIVVSVTNPGPASWVHHAGGNAPPIGDYSLRPFFNIDTGAAVPFSVRP